LQLEHAAKFAKIETEIDNMKITISDFSDIKNVLVELKLLSKQQLQFNERQIESNEKFEGTLTNINANLNSLNDRVGHLENLKEKEEDIAIENIKSNTENTKSKFVFYGVIAAGVLSVIGILLPLIIK
jgi:DNA repair exonuclease SbcCD ATPase subunit